MCLCVCAHVNAGYSIFWGSKPKARRAVKLLTTEGDVGGLYTGESFSVTQR